MQLRAGETVLLFSVIVSLTFVSLVFASITEVTLTPTQTLPEKSAQFSVLVKNLGGSNLNYVEVVMPQDNNGPLYHISEIGNPAGWSYETRYSLGASTPFRIIWSTSGSGIPSGQSLNFNFVATSPSSDGEFSFQWKAVDLSGVESSGSAKVTNINPVSTTFGLKMPSSIQAGKEFSLTVTALDQRGNVKSDYSGTIKFVSSDLQGIMPSDYNFQSSDMGVKTFKMKLKTAGTQSIKAYDGTLEGTGTIQINQGDVNSIELALDNSTVTPGNSVQFTVWSVDSYGNKKDVTINSKFGIDAQAKGTLGNGTYQSEALGNWTVIAKYVSNSQTFSSGKSLAVVEALPAPLEPEVIQPEGNASLEVVAADSFNIPQNSTRTFSLTVKNTGEIDLGNVRIVFSGFPEDQMAIEPSSADVGKGKSKLFTATVDANEKIEAQTVTFLVLSDDERATATKMVTFNVTESIADDKPSGNIALNKNFTYLGIAIVIAVVLILLFWALFLRDDGKKKKSEKSE